MFPNRLLYTLISFNLLLCLPNCSPYLKKRFETFTSVETNLVFRFTTSCSLIDGTKFRRNYCLRIRRESSTLFAPRKCWYPPTRMHGVITIKPRYAIFQLTCVCVSFQPSDLRGTVLFHYFRRNNINSVVGNIAYLISTSSLKTQFQISHQHSTRSGYRIYHLHKH
jgi:hypothetical protein